MNLGHFAVIDTETTGLFPGNHDRIAEIAVITMDRSGTVLDRWETLINPERDLGKQSLHGIRAKDILSAPRFTDIASELEWRLSGTIVVGHNLGFDARFLDAEFRRAGLTLPEFYLPRGLCTMQMAHEYLPGAGRSLQDCCDSFSIELRHAHSAGDDAEATAVLLARYMELDPDLGDWDFLLNEAAQTMWVPNPPRQLLKPTHRSTSASKEVHFVDRVVDRLPEISGPAEHQEYLALLDRALLDRQLSAHEQSALIALADELQISRPTIIELHSRYFSSVAATAWNDGLLTKIELEDLETIARLLRIPPAQFEVASRTKPRRSAVDSVVAASPRTVLKSGDLIVLTGDMTQPRSTIEAALESSGYIPHSAVTKKVKLLVAADPDTLSGKARKARAYGIPVVGEDFLWNQILNIPR
ncbi:exonuclease domain-containing protein [Paeniglutamicibacter sp. Y32M11]|uniref:exonuclease domain-containing protein n=1 Tax=Paeniglutamicibacter sp. Y32M11 TaxID=2853258 RepID=UPI001C531C3C|nr:exonuclease domain-containing protein [Paeniglutamicibacter sp. Y32M11]QXQ10659.1 DNA polymerase III subunit epsilon [Paeniglutamicibacter sp. Y32M11]